MGIRGTRPNRSSGSTPVETFGTKGSLKKDCFVIVSHLSRQCKKPMDWSGCYTTIWRGYYYGKKGQVFKRYTDK